MAKSIKLKNDTYWDSTGIVYGKETLDSILWKNLYGKRAVYTMSATTGWKRIAVLSGMAGGTITIVNAASYGTMGQLTFATGVGYNYFLRKDYKQYTNGNVFTKARLVLKGNSPNYLEIYQALAVEREVTIKLALQSDNVTLITSETAGSIPSGYGAQEIDF